MKRELKENMQTEVANRIAELKCMSFAELKTLPSPSDVKKQNGDKSYTLTTWTELQDNGKLEVGVYAYFLGWLNIGTSVHDGFIMTPDGKTEKMPIEMQVKCI
jgi:hypothetical protein